MKSPGSVLKEQATQKKLADAAAAAEKKAAEDAKKFVANAEKYGAFPGYF